MDDLRIGDLPKVPVQGKTGLKQKPSVDFGKIVKGEVDRLTQLESSADKSILNMLQGKAGVPETMIALQKADISMRLFLGIRNKVIEAYKEIMHMQF